jgi:hypothetical protein
MPSSTTLAEAVDNLLDAFRDRWPAFDIDSRTAWLRALSGAAPADVDALVLDAIGLDDRPPSPAVVARRVATQIADRLAAGGGVAPRPDWAPDPYVLGIIEDGRRRMAAAAERFRAPL